MFSFRFLTQLVNRTSRGEPNVASFVIGSNVGGIAEIITDDVGLLIDPNDSSSLSNAIDKIIGDSEFREKLSSNARKRAVDFSKVEIPYDEMK